MTKEDKTIKGLKRVNHKLKHQYDLLQIRHCALNSSYQRVLNALNEVIERNSKSQEYIKDYLCSYDYTSAEFKKIAEVFMDLINTLKGVELTENDKKQIKWLKEEFKVGDDKE